MARWAAVPSSGLGAGRPPAGPATDLAGPSGAPGTLSREARMLYRALAREGGAAVDRFEELVGTPAEACAPLVELQRLHLVRRSGPALVAVPRREAVESLLAEQADLLRTALREVLDRQERLATLDRSGPGLDAPGEDCRVETVTLDGRSPDRAFLGAGSPARRELVALHPGTRFTDDVLEASLERARTSLDAGVRLRVVHQSAALAHPSSARYLGELERLGGAVRVRDTLPFRMLLVDRETAVCSAPPGSAEQDTYLLRGRRVTTLLDRVFETTWLDATPLAGATPARPPVDAGAGGLTEQQVAVLRLLAEGETDQSIARRLGITSRTVTRRVTEIYEVLGVDSRFQAGAAAARLGLV